MRLLCAILVMLATGRLLAGEVMPPLPTEYFNDYAGVVSGGTAALLNQTLADFERQSSDQIVVAVYPTLQSDSDVADYCVRVFRSWGVGQKAKNNGAVLFVFVKDHKLFLQTGYGLEGVLPDARCKRIIDEQITPRFKAGDFNDGLTAGVAAILAATKGDYQRTGSTVADQHGDQSHAPGLAPILIFGFIFLVIVISRIFSPRSRRGIFYTGGGWGSGGGWSGGGGGGGGFSGGGGSSGGGGAGGSW